MADDELDFSEVEFDFEFDGMVRTLIPLILADPRFVQGLRTVLLQLSRSMPNLWGNKGGTSS